MTRPKYYIVKHKASGERTIACKYADLYWEFIGDEGRYHEAFFNNDYTIIRRIYIYT